MGMSCLLSEMVCGAEELGRCYESVYCDPPPTPMDGGWVEEALQSEGVLLGPPGSDMML